MEIQSQYFKLNEFLISQDAARFGITNTPTDDIINNIQFLCTKILDPLRYKIGKPIVISSGYRSPELNKKIGGAIDPPSQHIFGKAADIIIPGMTAKQTMDYILTNTKLPFDQIILEFGAWVHVSFDKEKKLQRGNVLQANIVNQKVDYTPYGG